MCHRRVAILRPAGLALFLLMTQPAGAALFPCDYAGFFAAIAAGNGGDEGPHTFDCSSATTVGLQNGATPVAQAAMTLDGGGLLTVSRGAFGGRVFAALGPGHPDPTIVLRNLDLEGGRVEVSHAHLVLEQVELRQSQDEGLRLLGDGTANLRDSAVLDSVGAGFTIAGNMTRSTTRVFLTRSVVSDNGLGGVAGDDPDDDVIARESLLSGNGGSGARGHLTISNSTLSGNGDPQLDCTSLLTCELSHSTIVSGGGVAISFDSDDAGVELVGNLIDGSCEDRAALPVGDPIESLGSNVEGPGDTCDLDAPYDLSAAFPAELGLGPLQDNGGPTETHALLAGSAAIGRGIISSCPAIDQRGVDRPEPEGTLCDSGAFEDPTPIDPVVFSCDHDGLFEALSFGNAGAYGPHTFDCTEPTTIELLNGPTPVAQFDMEIDGGGLLTLERGLGRTFAAVTQDTQGEVHPSVLLRGFRLVGGPVQVTESELTLEDVLISNPGSHGIDITAGDGSAVHLRDSAILGATGDGINGGFQDGPITLEGSTISGSSGRGVSAPGFQVTVSESTISGNGERGVYGGNLQVESSTISGNAGAQLDCTIGPCAVTHSTIASNGGVAVAGPVTFTSSIVEGSCESPGQSLGGNLEGPGDTCGFGAQRDHTNLSAGELDLGPLQANGGPTETHALLENSLALANAALSTCPLADQRGEPRPAPENALCDSGAYEHQTLPEPGVAGLLAGAVLLALLHAIATRGSGSRSRCDSSVSPRDSLA